MFINALMYEGSACLCLSCSAPWSLMGVGPSCCQQAALDAAGAGHMARVGVCHAKWRVTPPWRRAGGWGRRRSRALMPVSRGWPGASAPRSPVPQLCAAQEPLGKWRAYCFRLPSN